MIDEPGDVTAGARVDHRAVRELEAPDVAALDIAALALQAFLVRDLLAGVVDDALVLRNRARGEHTPPVDSRTAFLDHVINIAHATVRRSSAAPPPRGNRAVQSRRVLRTARDARAPVARRAA